MMLTADITTPVVPLVVFPRKPVSLLVVLTAIINFIFGGKEL